MITLRHHADGRKVFERVVSHFAQVRGDGEIGCKTKRQRVAVRLGMGHQLRAQVATGTDLVVHKHLLPQRRGQTLRHDAPQRVVTPAGREGHDEADGFVGVVLGLGGGGYGCQCRYSEQRCQGLCEPKTMAEFLMGQFSHACFGLHSLGPVDLYLAAIF